MRGYSKEQLLEKLNESYIENDELKDKILILESENKELKEALDKWLEFKEIILRDKNKSNLTYSKGYIYSLIKDL